MVRAGDGGMGNGSREQRQMSGPRQTDRRKILRIKPKIQRRWLSLSSEYLLPLSGENEIN